MGGVARLRPSGSAAYGRDRPGRSRSTARSGFGLIEAIVALAIAGLVLAAVTELAGRTLRSWDRGFATVAAVERTDIGLGRLATDLTNLLPVPLATADDGAVLFAGDSRGLSFTALTPLGRTEDGIAIVEMAIEGGADGIALVRRTRLDRDAAIRDGDRVVLIAGRLDLTFAYRDHAGRRLDTWSRPGEVPSGVIVSLRGDRSRGGGLPAEVLLPIPVDIAVGCLVHAPGVGDPETPPGANPAAATPGRPTAAPTGQATADQPSASDGDAETKRRCRTGPGNGAGGKSPSPGVEPPEPGGSK